MEKAHEKHCTPIVVQYGTMSVVLTNFQVKDILMTKTLIAPAPTATEAGEHQNNWSDARWAAVVEAAYVLEAVRR
jgi:hypothetical protein